MENPAYSKSKEDIRGSIERETESYWRSFLAFPFLLTFQALSQCFEHLHESAISNSNDIIYWLVELKDFVGSSVLIDSDSYLAGDWFLRILKCKSWND